MLGVAPSVPSQGRTREVGMGNFTVKDKSGQALVNVYFNENSAFSPKTTPVCGST